MFQVSYGSYQQTMICVLFILETTLFGNSSNKGIKSVVADGFWMIPSGNVLIFWEFYILWYLS